MRLKFGLKTVALPLACLCMAVPILTAIYLVSDQAERAEDRLILQYAREMLLRAEQTGDQLRIAAEAVNALSPEERCAPRGLDVMRKLDLDSTLLQAVGYVEGETLLCSSFMGATPIPLGKPRFVSAKQTVTWTQVSLYGRTPNFLVFSMGGAAGIVHRDLAVSFVGKMPGLTLGSFSWSSRIPLVQRAGYDARWIRGDLPDESVFRSNGYLIAVVRSKSFDVGAVAAVPLVQTASLESEAALVLLPIGLVTGIVFAVLMVHVVRSRLSLPSLIQLGLRRNEFQLVYQPGVDLATGRIVGAEVLMRWRRMDGELVPPDVFIAAAEDSGMIRLLTTRVIQLLGEAAERLCALPQPFSLAVNLSAADLHTPATVDALRTLLAEAGTGFPGLVAEVTERSLVDAEQAGRVIDQVRALGIRVAIDDFGTGYCSLSYLARLKADYIKIDRLFVHALGTDSPTSSVAGHIIDMARDLKLRTVAEGIETQAQAEILRRLGVDFGQGWLYGAPMTLDDLIALVDAQAVRERAPEAALAEA